MFLLIREVEGVVSPLQYAPIWKRDLRSLHLGWLYKTTCSLQNNAIVTLRDLMLKYVLGYSAVPLALWRLPEPALKTQLAFKHVIVAECTESIQEQKGQLKLQERNLSLCQMIKWMVFVQRWLCTVLQMQKHSEGDYFHNTAVTFQPLQTAITPQNMLFTTTSEWRVIPSTSEVSRVTLAAFLLPAGKLSPILSSFSLRERPPFFDLALQTQNE